MSKRILLHAILLFTVLVLVAGCQDVEDKDVESAPSVEIEGLDKFTEDLTPATVEIEEPVSKKPSCGDNQCNGVENKCTCSGDCGKCQGLASNLTQYKCVSDACVLAKVENFCGNALCEAGEKDACKIDCPECGDGDACTIDTFNNTNQKCAHVQVLSCCGNSICESGEDNRCLIDCPASDNLKITLASYPKPFVDDLKFHANIIVGSKGPAELVVSGIDIVRPLTFKAAGSGYSTNALLDNQVSSIQNKNVILIGNGCENTFVRQLMVPMSNPDCKDGLVPSKGLIRLYKTGDSTYALVIAGHSSKDTRAAAQVLGYYNVSKLTGLERKV